MALVQKAVNGLYKGITKQETTNRVEGQVEDSVNMLHTVEKGVSRRNPTELVKNLSLTYTDAYIHSYSRGDDIEEYIILLQDNMINVFDSDGNEISVATTPETLAYLNVPSNYKASTAFKTITVGDTTFISNQYITCKMVDEVIVPTEPQLANPFYWVKRSFDNGQGTGYDYTLDGVTVNSVKTTTACSQLVSKLNTNVITITYPIKTDHLEAFQTLDAGTKYLIEGDTTYIYTVADNVVDYQKEPYVVISESVGDYKNYGSIVVRKNRPTSFTYSDSYGAQASQGFWGSAEKIEDLPNTLSGAEEDYDFILEITGDADNAFTNFWVKYEDDTWKETVAPDLINDIDNSTMPIKLNRLADGTFELVLADYTPRKFGDDITASVPSFINKNITDIFFFKNRLCFVSKENVIMSEIGEFTEINFFPTTVTDVLASDPIDVAVDSNVVSFINHAVPFNDSVILMSTSGQFSLQADKVLSPDDVSITSTTSYDALKNISPLSLGSSLFFLSKTLQGTALREYLVDINGASNIANDVSGHVRGLIPQNISALVGNTNEDIIFIYSEDTKDTLYVYKFYTEGNDRIQNSFSKWVFDGDVFNITVLGDYLYILIDRGNGLNLERIDYTSNADNVTSYLDNGTINYDSYIILSQPILKDTNGTLIQSPRSPLMYRTIQLESTDDSSYQIKIEQPVRNRVAYGYATKDNKVLVQGKTKETTVTIQSLEDNPLEFHTYTTELNYNIRAKIV